MAYELKYKNRVYPSVMISGIPVGGWSARDIKNYWENENKKFENISLEFSYEDQIATLSGSQIQLRYDAPLSATQAYLIGRSGNILSDIRTKIFEKKIDLKPVLTWDENIIREEINYFESNINTPAENALFNFQGGKVSEFKPSKNGRKVEAEATLNVFRKKILSAQPGQIVSVPLEVRVVKPQATTDTVNNMGIKELIGRGYSEFSGSIAGRIHNVTLAASRFNGVLIKPGETLSFNKTLGDVSAATGYQSAYIIKNGRTVLGDGGGVCQASSTLFRAALDAGLPIIERHAHAYRVHYYEDGGFKAGMDATVFDPTADLIIKNDTPAHILIQTKTDTRKLSLIFELYGTSDGRKAEILNHRVWDISPPPEALYQDDPTLKIGVIKQVDWAAWGAKANFDYRVSRKGVTILEKSFYSAYRPWQAVYLKGTMP